MRMHIPPFFSTCMHVSFELLWKETSALESGREVDWRMPVQECHPSSYPILKMETLRGEKENHFTTGLVSDSLILHLINYFIEAVSLNHSRKRFEHGQYTSFTEKRRNTDYDKKNEIQLIIPEKWNDRMETSVLCKHVIFMAQCDELTRCF